MHACLRGLLRLQLRLLERLTKALALRWSRCSPGPAEARAWGPLNGFAACHQCQAPHLRWVSTLQQQLAPSVPSGVTACYQPRRGLHSQENLTTAM